MCVCAVRHEIRVFLIQAFVEGTSHRIMKAEMLHVKEREPEGEGDVALPEVTTTLKAFKDRFGIYGTVDYSGAKPYEDYSDKYVDGSANSPLRLRTRVFGTS